MKQILFLIILAWPSSGLAQCVVYLDFNSPEIPEFRCCNPNPSVVNYTPIQRQLTAPQSCPKKECKATTPERVKLPPEKKKEIKPKLLPVDPMQQWLRRPSEVKNAAL